METTSDRNEDINPIEPVFDVLKPLRMEGQTVCLFKEYKKGVLFPFISLSESPIRE
jgi:hypothetical protein